MHKLPELPPGTSKGLLHFAQCKGSTQVMRYNFSENNIQDTAHYTHVPQKEISKNKFTSQKTSQWTIPTSRTEKEQSCNCSQDISKNHQ